MSDSSSDYASAAPRADEAHAGSRPDVIRVSSPVSLLAAIPVTLGFQPSEPSFVVLGVTQPRSEVSVAIRYDIDAPTDAGRVARHAAGILAAQGIAAACAVGYGPGTVVTPVADAVRAQFARSGIAVGELMRAQDGRYWSYVCADPACCPPEGTTYDLDAHPVTRMYACRVLASRQALAATLAPATGDTAGSMRRATRAARRRWSRLAAGAAQDKSPRRALLEPLLTAVTDAIGRYRSGGKFESHEDAAWLALALTDIRVRDDAWARMEPGHRTDHLRLWRDLTVLARGRYAVAPATLLAFVAWQDGNGALGNVALDRALAEDPRYSMALLLRQALDSGAPRSMAQVPMTPEEVAAAYDQDEDHDQDKQDVGPAASPQQTSGNGNAAHHAVRAAADTGASAPAEALADA